MSNTLIFEIFFYNIYLNLVNSTDSDVLYKNKAQVKCFCKQIIANTQKVAFNILIKNDCLTSQRKRDFENV